MGLIYAKTKENAILSNLKTDYVSSQHCRVLLSTFKNIFYPHQIRLTFYLKPAGGAMKASLTLCVGHLKLSQLMSLRNGHLAAERNHHALELLWYV